MNNGETQRYINSLERAHKKPRIPWNFTEQKKCSIFILWNNVTLVVNCEIQRHPNRYVLTSTFH